ncbi:MAG: hypothetical protein NTX87_12885 [Planctomycetota bacterium]|nr:hypothetical protein [Planctomycetota bacterium]
MREQASTSPQGRQQEAAYALEAAPPQAVRRQHPDRRRRTTSHLRPSAAALRLQATIDEYKLARGLTRISLDELLDVLTRMGYREA